MADFVLRPNTIDEIVQQYLWEKNEYRVPEAFDSEDLIIDIGAHIGLFSHLCWQRGAHRILAFEPVPNNFELCQTNLAETSAIVTNKAVWKSDPSPNPTLFLTKFLTMDPDGPDPIMPGTINTGTASVFGQAGNPIEVIALDDIIGEETVRLLKLDCEGSEFPILLTSQSLQQVKCIVGEYHLLDGWPPQALIEGYESYTLGDLANCLTALGFQLEFVPSSKQVGNFFAYNLDL
jgi:FkbM family methyltransferase